MLKIKDNIDLKELEKFGFHNVDWDYENDCEMENANCYGEFYSKRIFYDDSYCDIYLDNKKIYIRMKDYRFYLLNCVCETLFDLIKADLVEKVDD